MRVSLARPLLAVGQVRHQRLRPVAHGFAYRGFFLLLPMRALRALPEPLLRRNRRGWLSFHDADHGDGRADSLAWLDDLLRAEGVADADGEVWLHTYPRVAGLVFKPVSFWYCLRADGTLAAVVAEVNNTFGERHSYVLRGPQLAWGRTQRADKRLHVSPFNQVEGGYAFRFLCPGVPGLDPAATPASVPGRPAHCVARIEYHDAAGPLLLTSQSGAVQPLSAAALRAVLWRMPWQSLGVVLRIHWQALRLALRGLPFFGRDGHARARALELPPAELPPA